MWLSEYIIPADRKHRSWTFSQLLCNFFISIDKGGVWWLDGHLSHKTCEGTMRFGQDPSVCVLLTDLSHITISMATRAVAVATASSQSVLQLDVRARWLLGWQSEGVGRCLWPLPRSTLPSSAVSLSTSLCYLYLLLPPSQGKQHPLLLPSSPKILRCHRLRFAFLPFHTLHAFEPSFTLFLSVISLFPPIPPSPALVTW